MSAQLEDQIRQASAGLRELCTGRVVPDRELQATVDLVVGIIDVLPLDQSKALRRDLDRAIEPWKRDQSPQPSADKSDDANRQLSITEAWCAPSTIARAVDHMLDASPDIRALSHSKLVPLIQRIRHMRPNSNGMCDYLRGAVDLIEQQLAERMRTGRRPVQIGAGAPIEPGLAAKRSMHLSVSVEHMRANIGSMGHITAEDIIEYGVHNRFETIAHTIDRTVLSIGRGPSNSINISAPHSHDDEGPSMLLFCGMHPRTDQYVLVDLQSTDASSSSLYHCINTGAGMPGSAESTRVRLVSQPSDRRACALRYDQEHVLWLDREDILIKINADRCVGCSAHAVNTVAMPCKHYILCETCAFSSKNTCLKCRQPATYQHAVINPHA